MAYESALECKPMLKDSDCKIELRCLERDQLLFLLENKASHAKKLCSEAEYSAQGNQSNEPTTCPAPPPRRFKAKLRKEMCAEEFECSTPMDNTYQRLHRQATAKELAIDELLRHERASEMSIEVLRAVLKSLQS
jgi:hypothetical protein